MEPQPNVGSHLTYFKIENFKRFDSFEMSNLGQFNLIVGDNNVGKTSVLEALLFDEDLDQLMGNFLGSLQQRNAFGENNESLNWEKLYRTHFWQLIFKNEDHPIIFTTSNAHKTPKEFMLQLNEFDKFDEETKKSLRSLHPRMPNWWIRFASLQDGIGKLKAAYTDLEITNETIFVPFISTTTGYGNELTKWFSKYLNGDKSLRKEFESYLNFFIPNLEETRIHQFGEQNVLGIILTDSDKTYPIYQFGEATVKLTRLLFEIFLAKGKRLMVDEIGSGIHFTRLVDYWKTVIRLCDQYKVQLFATTHSLECQQAFVEALEAPDMQQFQKDARNVTIIENNKGEVEAVTFDFEQFEYALNIGFNTRGGKL